MNHYPIFKRQAASECKPLGGTVDPFAPVTCPSCRARLTKKRDSHSVNAANAKPGSQEFKFETGCAAQWEKTLAA